MFHLDIPYNLQMFADSFHKVAVLYTIFHLISRRSAQGISAKTQSLYLLVFVTRYLDQVTGHFISWYNTLGKIFFTSTALIIVVLMQFYKPKKANMVETPKTDTYNIGRLVYPAFILALVFNYASSLTCVIFTSKLDCIGPIDKYRAGFIAMEVLWSFSRFLEPVVLIPQIYMLKRERALKIDSGAAKFTYTYGFFLTFYELFYVAKQAYQAVHGYADPISLATHSFNLGMCVSAMQEGSIPIPNAITLDEEVPEEPLTDGEKAALLVQDNLGSLSV